MSQANQIAKALIDMSKHDGQLTRLAQRVTEAQAAAVVVDLVDGCYAIRAFSTNGQALELVEAVIANHAAGVYSDLDCKASEPTGLHVYQYLSLTSIDMAALLCLVVVYLLERRYLGPTQIKLLTRDHETAIACAKDDTPAA